MSPRAAAAYARKTAELVCLCLRVTEEAVLRAVKSGRAKSLKDLARHTGAGEGCTACHPALREYLKKRYSPSSSSPSCWAR